MKSFIIHKDEEHRLWVFENRLLRKIFGQKSDELIRGWRKLHNEELHNLFSPDVIRVIKSRRIGWAGLVDLWGQEECI
jgi:hypothetical protein